jgi:hypothetical protein
MNKDYKGNDWRPVKVEIRATFPKKGARKVTPADLEKAAASAAVAFREHLEARTPAYEVLDLEFEVQYAYLQAWASAEL